MEEEKSWFEKNQKKIIIGGIIIATVLLLTPDIYLRKFIPWVK
jgi:predicted negative regulator of RcsB-dependent stress response